MLKAKSLFLVIIICSFAIVCCKKESDKKYCWQGFDPSGSIVPGLIYCDKTEEEAQVAFNGYWFFKQDETTYCWRNFSNSNDTVYLRHLPASMVEKLNLLRGYSFQKTDCASFCTWRWLDKHQSKITGRYSETRGGIQTYFSDSCQNIYKDRIIIQKETTDSIIYREFIEEINP